MAIILEPDYTLKLIQGDCGGFRIDGIPTDKNYHVYFQIRDRNNRPVGEQLMAENDGADFVEFYIDAELSDKLRVPFGRKFEPYSYGIKIYDPDTEAELTTIINGPFGKPNRLIVYPIQAEGPGSCFRNPSINVRPIDYKPHESQREKDKFVTKTDMKRALATKIDRADIEELEDEMSANISASVMKDVEDKITEVVDSKMAGVESRIEEVVDSKIEDVEDSVGEIVDSKMENYATKEDLEHLSGVFFREL